MNKSDLVDRLTEQLKTLSRKEVDLFVDTVCVQLCEGVGQGERLEGRGAG